MPWCRFRPSPYAVDVWSVTALVNRRVVEHARPAQNADRPRRRRRAAPACRHPRSRRWCGHRRPAPLPCPRTSRIVAHREGAALPPRPPLAAAQAAQHRRRRVRASASTDTGIPASCPTRTRDQRRLVDSRATRAASDAAAPAPAVRRHRAAAAPSAAPSSRPSRSGRRTSAAAPASARHRHKRPPRAPRHAAAVGQAGGTGRPVAPIVGERAHSNARTMVGRESEAPPSSPRRSDGPPPPATPHPGQRGGSASRTTRRAGASRSTDLLSRGRSMPHKRPAWTTEIFDRAARRLRRDRAAADFAAHDFLRAAMLDGIAERLDTVTRRFEACSTSAASTAPSSLLPAPHVVRCDAGAVFAARAACRRTRISPPFAEWQLRPDRLRGRARSGQRPPRRAGARASRAPARRAVPRAPSSAADRSPTLRAALRSAEPEPPAARLHPQIDVRSAGDLLVRAGFALPVADVETLDVRYPDVFALASRPARHGGDQPAAASVRPLTRGTLDAAAQAFAALADADGRVRERFDIVFLTGWAPDPSQPRAAKRGSATASLVSALAAR